MGPVLSNIQEALHGRVLARSMGLDTYFTKRHDVCVDAFTRATFASWAVLSWAQLVSGFLASLLPIGVTIWGLTSEQARRTPETTAIAVMCVASFRTHRICVDSFGTHRVCVASFGTHRMCVASFGTHRMCVASFGTHRICVRACGRTCVCVCFCTYKCACVPASIILLDTAAWPWPGRVSLGRKATRAQLNQYT
jgi:hypothetical protein